MKRLVVTALLCWMLSLAGGSDVRGAGPNELTPEEKAAGWRLLFDGNSAELWRGWNQKGLPAKGWSVADGCLKCATTNGRPNGGGGDLLTVEVDVPANDPALQQFAEQWDGGGNPRASLGV